MRAREASAKAVARVVGQRGSLNEALAAVAERVAPEERPLLSELSYGALRFYPALEPLLGKLLQKPLKAKDLEVHTLLICALYQLCHTRIPDHAVVNESVDAAKSLKRPWARGLINGVLRRFLREREQIETALSGDLAAQSAHPLWLVEAIEQAWPEQAALILAANNQRAPLTLRLNISRQAREAYLAENFSNGGAAPTAYSDYGVQLEHPRPVDNIPGFAGGLVSVQDEAAQLAAQLLAARPGERVLDACCAPGGKTCHLLELTPDLYQLDAVDIERRRLDRVRENLDRLQLNATLIEADVTATSEWWDGRAFDRILLDAPCSATGVIRRHPDIKLLRQVGDVAKLAKLQRDMLARLWPLLKHGGRLLYATCSILPAENDEVVAAFLESTTDARLVPVASPAGIKTGYGRQLLPQVGGHDGFYYALLEKYHSP